MGWSRRDGRRGCRRAMLVVARCEQANSSDAGLAQDRGPGIYTLEEVAEHCTEESCWIIGAGYVYDVTNFLLEHPGGKQALLEWAGRDCSRQYNFHSKSGRQQWEAYRIGEIESTLKRALRNAALLLTRQ
eukprot:TRINITY_DN2457_c0_g2_i1.p1 TRINITY_DN2457_c0_g2~~TRINITY_DN2457_c0_g2_i1.p1  ORF type:complete len:130 (+),score=22.20 TRINITY_DN2457_c0_g2_i1:72-461(+)